MTLLKEYLCSACNCKVVSTLAYELLAAETVMYGSSSAPAQSPTIVLYSICHVQLTLVASVPGKALDCSALQRAGV